MYGVRLSKSAPTIARNSKINPLSGFLLVKFEFVSVFAHTWAHYAIGCYVRDEGPRRVSVSMLYAWLEMIIDLPLKGELFDHWHYVHRTGGHASNLNLDVEDTAKFALFLIPVDPRLGTKSFPIGDIPIHPHALPVLRSDGNETVKEGHYMIYKIGNSGSMHPRTPTLNVLSQTIDLMNISLFGRRSSKAISRGGAVPHRRPAHLL